MIGESNVFLLKVGGSNRDTSMVLFKKNCKHLITNLSPKCVILFAFEGVE